MLQNRNIKLVATKRRKKYLISERNYQTKKLFTEYVLAIEIRKTQILINKPAYLGLSILDLSETVIN